MKELIELEEIRFNKFLIVGNKYSNYKYIEELLLNNGIKKASKLKKEKISPKSVSKIILETSDFKKDKKFMINPIWNGLAMDLFLSNRNKDYWLWSDKNSIDILDYWKSVDANIAFVLVYSTPEYFLNKVLLKSSEELSEKNIKLETEKWISYNRKLLNFYYKNEGRCVLVNSEQVSKDSMQYIESLKEQKLLKNIFSDIQNVNIVKKEQDIAEDKILEYLINKVISGYKGLNNLYQEIQSCATFPLDEKNKTFSKPIGLLNLYSSKENLFNKTNERNNKLLSDLDILQSDYNLVNEKLLKNDEENKLLLSQLFSVQEELEKSYIQNKDIEKKQNELKSKVKNLEENLSEEKKSNSKKQIELKEENELLFSQLFSVQEELEKKYIQNKDIEKKQNELKSKVKNLEESLNKEKKTESRKEIELKEENELLLSQLFLVQEELEKYYLQNQDLKTNKSKLVKKKYYGAAERIKEQLSYRLGSKMINDSKTFGGTISLPFRLYAESRAFKKEKREQVEKLPPIHTYADAHDAERIKGHLSYKLGKTMIKCMKSPFGIIKLPFVLKSAHNSYKKEKRNV